jgi:hypothetical protein
MKIEDITLDWLMARVIERDGCLIWNGSYGGKNLDHPQTYINGVTISVRKLVWQLSNGRKMPRGYRAKCFCGELGCVHPDHIEKLRHSEEFVGVPISMDHRIRMTLTKRKQSRFDDKSISDIRSGRVAEKQAIEQLGMSHAYYHNIKAGEKRRDLNNPFAGLGA